MDDDVIPEDVRQFFVQNIDSIAQWEALLILRDAPDRNWSAESIAQRLYIIEAEAAQLLEKLLAQSFLCVVSQHPLLLYRYQPESPERACAVDRAATFYAKCLVPVTHLIHANSKNRIQKFADAFKIRKD